MLGRHLRKIKSVKKFRHFRFDLSTPGVVHVRHEAEGVETTLDLGLDPDWAPSSRVLLHVLPPSGLSFERRTYLYEKIREFVPEELRDVVCCRPEHTTTTTITTPGLPEDEEDQPPVKRGPSLWQVQATWAHCKDMHCSTHPLSCHFTPCSLTLLLRPTTLLYPVLLSQPSPFFFFFQPALLRAPALRKLCFSQSRLHPQKVPLPTCYSLVFDGAY